MNECEKQREELFNKERDCKNKLRTYKSIIDKQEIELKKCREYEHNTKEIIETIIQIAKKNGVIGKHELLKVINDD